MYVFISGPSGVGKTTVTNELVRRGQIAYDIDNVPGLARLELRDTGEPSEWPKGYIDWGKYAWNVQPAVLDEVLSRHKSLFLSGIFGNQPDFYHKFGKLIVLTVDPDQYLHQMRTRPYRGYNDDEINIQQRVAKYAGKIQQFTESGFIPVDNFRPVEQTVDEILRIVYEN